MPRPRFGYHHHHRVRERPACRQEQFERVVECGGVALLHRCHDREQLGNIASNRRRFEHCLPRSHPIDVAAQGIDLAVVDHVAVRVRQLPLSQRVRAEPRVHHGKAGHEVFVAEVAVEVIELARQEESLVHHLVGRKSNHVEVAALGEVGPFHELLDLPPDDVEAHLEGDGVGVCSRCSDEELADDRHMLSG